MDCSIDIPHGPNGQRRPLLTALTGRWRLPLSLFPLSLFVVSALLIVSQAAAANTVVRLSFTVGGQAFGNADFRLFAAAMPRSVDNFLEYLERYSGTFIHRNTRNPSGDPDGNFVVQGGGFSFVPPSSAPGILTDPPILDEPGDGVQGISNLRGTLSNAKSGPDTVTSQWFVNLDDNSFLDSPTRSDGGFGAFGRVLGSGIDVFDQIDLLNKLDLDGAASSLFNDVPVGDVNDALGTLVIVESAILLDLLDGDYDLDGDVDADDLAVWQQGNGSSVDLAADNNGDAIVNGDDFLAWQSNFGTVTAVSAFSVPEPSTIVLTCLGLLTILFRHSSARL